MTHRRQSLSQIAAGYAEHEKSREEKLSSSMVDVIVTDLMMPRMDGTQLLQGADPRRSDASHRSDQSRKR